MIKHPEMSISQQLYPSKDILLFPNLPASKNLPEEQIFSRILRNRSIKIGVPLQAYRD